MKSDEETLEQVLSSLGEAGTPNGMERRIMQDLEMRSRAESASHWGSVAERRPLFWKLGTVCVITGALIVVGVYRPGRNPTTFAQQDRAATMPKSYGRSGTQSLDEIVPPQQNVRLRFSHQVSEQRWGSRNESEPYATAATEAAAVSFPAPPMPLTEQEELLLRIAHKGDPEEWAMLEPEIREAREAEEKAEVQRFFETKNGYGAAIQGDTQ